MATVLVTGANRGIGLSLCRVHSGRGDTVIGVCREPSEALQALGARVVDGVDVTDDAGLRRLREALGDTRIDVLMNNAGVLGYEDLKHLDVEGIRRQFEVNALGPLRVTAALLPNLGRGSKIGILTSRMGSIADNGSGQYYGYRMSKAAVNAAGKSMALDLRGEGIAVAILHPGFVRTDMTRGGGSLDPDEAARGLVARMDALTLENTGTFWHMNGEVLPW